MMLEQLQFKTAPAAPGNVFVKDNARFTFLTPRLVRLEWSADGVFEDRETLAVLNRNLGEVKFSVQQDANGILLDSGALKIEYRPDGRKFHRGNLRAEFEMNGEKVVWHPGDAPTGNLLGTCRTLDGYDGKYHISNWENPMENRTRIKLCKGFLSRDGWSLIDDSSNIVLEQRPDGRKWVAPRTQIERQDYYLLAYGHDYKAALHDAAEVFGSQPIPPRFALGYWYSRYWAYSDQEIEALIDGFDRSGTPIDVMVVDMDWHLEGWTGYTWDWRYFPDPSEFLANLHRRGCKVTLNLHPAQGVGKHEAQFEAMAKAMGLDPKKVDRVPFDITDPKYMKYYFEILHHPEEKRGVDFWWMDWQQGESTAIPGLDTLPWINHLHWEDMQRRPDRKRPLIFSRFGGVGAGRYVIGFSGDTLSTWESLTYQPEFTATAANVLYGYWSHDLGGHMPGNIAPELYLRWLQFGMYSPIMRTHTTKNANAERRFWAYPEPFSTLMTRVVRDRYALVPYIYSENRRAYETGVSLCHPLYYEYPEDPQCYKEKQAYFFGSEMIVVPVHVPVDPESELAAMRFYLPQGKWYDTVRGEFVEGGKILRRKYMLDEVPLFVRPGAVIPGQQVCTRLNEKSYSSLTMTAYPGGSGSYDLYEDDGETIDYIDGKFARIRMAQRREGSARILEIRHADGTFPGFLTRRKAEFRLPGTVPPSRVTINGREVKFCYRFDDDDTMPAWRYDATSMGPVIRAGVIDLEKGVECRVEYAGVEDESLPAAGLKGVFNRLERVAILHNSLGGCDVTKYNERLGQQLGHTAHRIAHHPETFDAEIAALWKKLPSLPREIQNLCEAVNWVDGMEIRRKSTKIAVNLIKDCKIHK